MFREIFSCFTSHMKFFIHMKISPYLVSGWNILAFALLLCLWARQGLRCAIRAVTRSHGFCNLFRRIAPFCHLVICMESRWSSVLRLNLYTCIGLYFAPLFFHYPSFNFKRSCCFRYIQVQWFTCSFVVTIKIKFLP